ncbi:MAG: type II toxin-antitoxin system VapC family toxin [Planctomycetaceae bacterium]|nr:type II toxin-antitoxin system VapC family toxin [Planctomycetaceae bacterium]
MASNVVFDSCVVAKWILPEVDSDKAQQVLTETAQAGGRAVVLDIAFAEVANAIWKRLHRELITSDEAQNFLDDLLTLPVLVQPAKPHLRVAFEIAAQHDRSVYDALVVAAARDLGLQAVTSVEPLRNSVQADYPEIRLLRDW